mmetsp:Transcript_34338/g.73175  ORF Transcript_34338/g.73175 Transcript_34338/m.73175 type:complete len:91 (-) Transcript_34338:129-401(-)
MVVNPIVISHGIAMQDPSNISCEYCSESNDNGTIAEANINTPTMIMCKKNGCDALTTRVFWYRNVQNMKPSEHATITARSAYPKMVKFPM